MEGSKIYPSNETHEGFCQSMPFDNPKENVEEGLQHEYQASLSSINVGGKTSWYYLQWIEDNIDCILKNTEIPYQFANWKRSWIVEDSIERAGPQVTGLNFIELFP